MIQHKVVYSSRLAVAMPEVKRSKVKVTSLQEQSLVMRAQSACAAAAAGVGLHVDTTAYFF